MGDGRPIPDHRSAAAQPARDGGPDDGDLTVAVAPLPGRGRGPRRAAVAAAGVIGLIAIAFASAWLAPSGPGPAVPARVSPAAGTVAQGGASGSSASAGTPASGAPQASAGFPWFALPSPIAITPVQLVEGTRDGSLDGGLVLMQARLIRVPGACTQPSDLQCVSVSVAGLDLPVDMAPGLAYWQAPPDNGTLVMRPADGRLVYLGALGASIDAPTSMEELLARRPIQLFPITLSPVRGWLVVSPFRACGRPIGPKPCGQVPPFFADDQPLLGGVLRSDRGAEVRLEPGALGLLNGSNVSGGTYLVRHGFRSVCGGAPGALASSGESACPDVLELGWDVVARLDGLTVYSVTVAAP